MSMEDGEVDRSVSIAVLRIRICSVLQHGVHDVCVAAHRRVVDERARRLGTEQLA